MNDTNRRTTPPATETRSTAANSKTAHTIAALYVQADGCYAGVSGVEVWDEARDARKYGGPFPVVAHPPCQLWVNLAAVNFKRYGGAHNKPGNDGGCFAAALAAVRKFGGVLEHPAFSNAWASYGLPRPEKMGWSKPRFGWTDDDRPFDEWVCEVWQSAYGHKARKRTWLLYVGPSAPSPMLWERSAGTHQVGWFDRIKPTLSKSEASATPDAFRDALLSLAGESRAARSEAA